MSRTVMHGRSDLKWFAFLIVLTAMATITSHYLPRGARSNSLGLVLDVVPVVGVVIATIFAARRFRESSSSRTHLVIALYQYLAGSLITVFGVAHTCAVAIVSLDRARQQQFAYSFRFYSLMLLGLLLIVAGLMAAIEARRLGRGSVSVWAAILAINLPLAPLQGFAIFFSGLAAVALLLLGVRGRTSAIDVTP